MYVKNLFQFSSIEFYLFQVHKTLLIEQLPPILIIHLKCFLYDESDGTKKINKSLTYTVNLTLPKSNF
jgi:hypothetical protein